jgi:putative transposase
MRRKENRKPLPRIPGWRDIKDEFWEEIKDLIPHPKKKKKSKGGRPRLDVRKVMNGIFYVLRTGCQWKMMPKEYGSGSSAHRYFQRWVKAGVFRKMWKRCLQEYDELKGIKWEWQILDTQTVQSPVKGEKNRKKPHGSG